MPTNLRDLIPVCGDKLDWSVPVWDSTECRWTAQVMWSTGPVDCIAVQACMQSTINTINVNVTNLTNTVNGLTTVVNNIGSVAHTHTNKALLDSITNSGSSLSYLGWDGAYHNVSDALNSSILYQTIYTTGFGAHTQRAGTAYGPEFIITDDAVNNRTIIAIDPAYLGGGGGSSTDDYVVSWSYNPLTKNLTLVRVLWGTVVIDLSGIVATTSEVAFPASLASTVICNHNLNKRITPVCVNSSGVIVAPYEVSVSSPNSVTVTFSTPFTGTIYCS